MDIKNHLNHLPEPDPESLDRVWRRYKESRSTADRRSFGWATWGAGATLVCAVAAAALFVILPAADGQRHEVLASVDTMSTERWTDEVELSIEGRGEIAGTSKNAEIQWQSGTVTSSVRPKSGNQLKVVTEEAVVEVVGTVFSVTRDALGTSTRVDKGRVKVTCTGGWSGEIGPEDGTRVCLPVRSGALVGRFNKLKADGASLDAQLATLDAGLTKAAPGSAHEDQLLLGRLEVHGERGDVDQMLRDADAYLSRARSKEVDARQYVSRALLAAGNDCRRALPYLAELEHTGTAVDRVLLAECLLTQQPTRARTLLDDALPQLDGEWQARATALRGLLDR